MSADHLAAGHQYIHYDPDRVDYSVTDGELAQLDSAGSNLWKDVCLVCAPIALSCLVNAIADSKQPFALTVPLFLNYLFGVVGLILAVIFGIAWHRSRTSFRSVIDSIKKKPKMQIRVPATVDVGSLPEAELSPALAPQKT
jgi:hypothetical protein